MTKHDKKHDEAVEACDEVVEAWNEAVVACDEVVEALINYDRKQAEGGEG